MMRIKFLYLLLFSIVFTACDSKSHSAQEVKTVSVQSNSKNIYTLTTLQDENITLEVSKQLLISKKLNGKMVLVNFWAPWCKPCVKEMPTFVELQKKYKDDLIIIGVLFDKKSSIEQVKEFVSKYNINFPITVGEENYKLAKKLDDVTMIPESFLYDTEGLFLEKFVGEVNKDKLESYLQKTH